MAKLEEIYELLKQIKDELVLASQRRLSPNQITIIEGLSDISRRLGLVQAGEFRAGNSVEPGTGFTGVRMGYPPFLYNGDNWNVVGIKNDKLQFGLAAVDGKAYAAGGNIIMDSLGIHSPARQIMIRMGADDTRLYTFGAAWGIRGTSTASVFGLVDVNIDSGVAILEDNFEDGDLVGWTQTGTPTIVKDSPEDIYSVEVNSTNYITRAVTTTPGSTYAILLSIRTDADPSTFSPTVNGGAVEAAQAWGQILVFFLASAASTNIVLSSSNASQVRYDDLKVYLVTGYSVVGSILDGEGALNLEGQSSVNLYSEGSVNLRSKTNLFTFLKALEQSSTPGTPSAGSEVNIYMKADKLIFQYNDAGTVRYKYLDLTGTGVTWVHTTVAP